MNCEYVTVYNQDGEMLGVLENAGEVAYNLVHNDLVDGVLHAAQR